VTLTIVFNVTLVVLVLYRQRRIRRVPPRLRLRTPIVIGLLGFLQLLAYTDHHNLTARTLWEVLATLVIGAGVLGALRAMTVRIWNTQGLVLRQGTWLTMALWAFSLAVHFVADRWIGGAGGTTNLASATLLLYLGVTLGIQGAVVQRRALGLLRSNGPIEARAEEVPGVWWAGFGAAGQKDTLGRHGGAIEATAEPIDRPRNGLSDPGAHDEGHSAGDP